MLVLLPGEKSNVWTLTRDLQHDRLVSILSQLQPTEVSVELPRFHIEYSADLVDHLKQVCITLEKFLLFIVSVFLSQLLHRLNYGRKVLAKLVQIVELLILRILSNNGHQLC